MKKPICSVLIFLLSIILIQPGVFASGLLQGNTVAQKPESRVEYNLTPSDKGFSQIHLAQMPNGGNTGGSAPGSSSIGPFTWAWSILFPGLGLFFMDEPLIGGGFLVATLLTLGSTALTSQQAVLTGPSLIGPLLFTVVWLGGLVTSIYFNFTKGNQYGHMPLDEKMALDLERKIAEIQNFSEENKIVIHPSGGLELNHRLSHF